MKRLSLLALALTLLSAGVIDADPAKEKTVDQHFEDSLPFTADASAEKGKWIPMAAPSYQICKEVKRNVAITGAGNFYIQASNDHTVLYGYNLTADTATQKPSSITGDISVLFVPDRSKAHCPPLNEAFPGGLLQEGPSNSLIRSLVPDKIFSQHFSDNLPYANKDDGPTKSGSVDFNLPRPYTACRELKREISMDGAVQVIRAPLLGDQLISYSYILFPDSIFHKTSTISGDISILAVGDRAKAKCPSIDHEFYKFADQGPSYHWVRYEGYVATAPNSVSTSKFLKAKAPKPDWNYCTHEVFPFAQNGRADFSFVNQDSKQMTILIGANPTSGQGSSMGAALLVKFVPHPEQDTSCTSAVFVAGKTHTIGKRSLPDGNTQFYTKN